MYIFQRIYVLVLGLWMTLTMVSCAGLSPDITIVEPDQQSLGIQQLELRNCQSQEDIHKFLSDDFHVEKTIQIADQAKAVSTGESRDIPPEIKSQLEEQIENAYQQLYVDGQEMLETTEIIGPMDKIRLFRIEIVQKTCASTLTFRMDRQVYSVDYVYELRLPNDRGFWEISCTA